MATITKPMALDESFKTTETTPRNIADVLAEMGEAIAQGMGRHANEVSYDNTTSGLSADDVQEAVDELAEEKVDKVTGKGLSTNDYTDAEKNKLEGIEAGAQVNPQIDSELSDSSTNAVQNKVVKGALDGKADNVDVEGTQSVSGNPITLTDASETYAQSLVVELEPKQDLHGQDAPYVGGAGDNILEVTASSKEESGVTWTVESNGIIKVSGTASGYTYLIVGRAFVNSTMGNIIVSGVDYTANITWAYIRIYDVNDSMVADITIQSAFGNVTVDLSQYPTAYKLDVAVKRNNNIVTNGTLYLQVNKGTTVKPWTPYSNICPITGYTECEVEDVGNNMFNPQYFIDRGATYSDGYYNGAYAFFKYGVDDFNDATSYKPNTRYVVSYNIYADANVNARVVIKHTDGTTTEASASVTTETRRTVVSAENKSVDKIYTIFSNSGNVHIKDMQIEEGTTPTTYEPYTHKSATIQFGQTVMGGTLDVTNGVLTVDMASVDMGDLTWTYYSIAQGNLFRCSITDIKPTSNTLLANCICSQYSVVTQDNRTNGTISSAYNTTLIDVIDNRYSDASTFKTAMDGVQLAYELAEPFTIQLTPQELKLLKQYNNLTTNGTTINLDYIPDNSIGDAVRASEEYADRAVNRGIEQHLEMPYLRILDNDVDTEVKNYQLYYRMIASAYTLVNLAEILQHRFLFIEVVQNPSGTASDELLNSALIDPRTIDGLEYRMKAGTGDTVIIKLNIDESKFDLSVRYTGTHTSGDPTDYYVTIRLVD